MTRKIVAIFLNVHGVKAYIIHRWGSSLIHIRAVLYDPRGHDSIEFPL